MATNSVLLREHVGKICIIYRGAICHSSVAWTAASIVFYIGHWTFKSLLADRTNVWANSNNYVEKWNNNF